MLGHQLPPWSNVDPLFVRCFAFPEILRQQTDILQILTIIYHPPPRYSLIEVSEDTNPDIKQSVAMYDTFHLTVSG